VRHRMPARPLPSPAAARAETMEPRTLLSTAAALSDLTLFPQANVAPYSTLGDMPNCTPVQDAAGDLFGTNFEGGAEGDGTLWEVAKGTNLPVVLASFGAATGAPQSQLAIDGSGDVYGVTGTALWEWTRGATTITSLATYTGGSTGDDVPEIGLVRNASGNLFGTIQSAGTDDDGELFEWTPGATSLTAVATFDAFGNGLFNPSGALAVDAAGNIFGTTIDGAYEYTAAGALNKLGIAADIQATALYDVGVAVDSADNVYGFAEVAGAAGGSTLVFKTSATSTALTTVATPDASINTLYTSPVLLDATHLLDASAGYSNGGTLFEVDLATGTTTKLDTLAGPKGTMPIGGLLISNQTTTGSDGFTGVNVYGLAETGTPGGGGALFVYGAPDASAAVKTTPTQLVFDQQPTTVASTGVTIAPPPVVYLEDANGNLVLADDSTVTMSIDVGFTPDLLRGSASPDAISNLVKLGGTVTATAVNGIATFSDLSIATADPSSSTYVLIAKDAALTVTSTTFGLTNNTGTPTPTPTPTPTGTATLTVAPGKSTLPSSLIGGTKVKGTVTATITNSGAATVKATDTVNLFATTTGAIDPGSTLIGSVKHGLSLKPGKTATVAVPANKGVALPAGTYTVLAQVVDATLGTSAAATGPTLTVAAPFASLTGTVTPLATTPGKTLSFTLTITNGGNVNAAGKATLAVYLSLDGTTLSVPVTPVLTKSLTVKPGKPLAVRLKVKVPTAAAAGNYFPLVSFTQGAQLFTAAAATKVAVG